MRKALAWTVMLATLAFVPAVPVGPAVAGGLRAVPVATGLDIPIGFTFLPDGRIAYLERNTGWLRFLDPTTDRDHRVYRVTNVNANGERGALGVAIHPDWPDRHVAYVFATRDTSHGVRNQVLRIRIEGGVGTRVRRLISAGAGPATNHNGGRIAFGPDDKLYVVIGDNATPANAQDRSSNLRGKILRINPDGSVPASNPFDSRVWAYGIRNSIGFAFDPQTDRLWEQDNGPECNDEINLIVKGGNHGWGPRENCPNTNNSGPRPRTLPKHTFSSTFGLTGVVFCQFCGLGPGYHGDLFVGAVNDDRIRRFNLNGARNDVGAPSVVLAHAVISMEVGPNNRIYFSDFGAIYRLAPPA
jgi:glucose/arabinose dehydrogenase